jgi:hypothetical protein
MKALAHTVIIWMAPLAGVIAQETAPPSAQSPQTDFHSPQELFTAVAKHTKPHWRGCYRENVARDFKSRQETAFALGALMADVALAAQARDGQQVRNLLQEQSKLEKALGVEEKMLVQRQRVLTHVEEENWPECLKSIEHAASRQGEMLRALRDEDLIAIADLGRWLRVFQICTKVALERELHTAPQDMLAIGHTSCLSKLRASAEAVVTADAEVQGCIKKTARKLADMEKDWLAPAPDGLARLKTTETRLAEILQPLSADKRAP